MKVLIISSHPDDEVLGCGGTIRNFASQGISVYVLLLTCGAESKKNLKEDCLKAHKILGTREVFFEGFPNQLLDTVPILKINETIEKYLAKINPEIVFTHHYGDINRDHKIAFESTFVAVRPLFPAKVKKLYSYFVASSTEWNACPKNAFIPNTFIDIQKSLDYKIRAMKCYKTEYRDYPHPRSAKSIKLYANYWGIIAGLKFAESFLMLRETIK